MKYLHTTHRNPLWFKKAFEENELEINPPFQRNPVWTDKQKSFLIDSMLNGFPIPEMYMQDIITDEGKAKYVVVDGQQRIRAFLDFIYEKFALVETENDEWRDCFFTDLSPENKRKLFEYKFVVRILPELEDAQIRNIFSRLNRNTVALNPQELRQATYWGAFITTVNTIAEKEAWADFKIFTHKDIKRMLDCEFISELIIAILHGPQNKKQTLDKYYQIYEEEFESRESMLTIFDKVLGELIQILPDFSKYRWKKKTDFYTLFLEFASNSNKLPLTSEKRFQAREKLIIFANSVDDYIRTLKIVEDEPSTTLYEDIATDVNDNVKLYSQGLGYGTADLGSRKNRQRGLANELLEIWS